MPAFSSRFVVIGCFVSFFLFLFFPPRLDDTVDFFPPFLFLLRATPPFRFALRRLVLAALPPVFFGPGIVFVFFLRFFKFARFFFTKKSTKRLAEVGILVAFKG